MLGFPLNKRGYSRGVAGPEDRAGGTIAELLWKAGWHVVDPGEVNLSAFRGTAIRNFTLKPGHGFADYLLHVHGKAVGVIEAEGRCDPNGLLRQSILAQAFWGSLATNDATQQSQRYLGVG
jgi:hypothetical protein